MSINGTVIIWLTTRDSRQTMALGKMIWNQLFVLVIVVRVAHLLADVDEILKRGRTLSAFTLLRSSKRELSRGAEERHNLRTKISINDCFLLMINPFFVFVPKDFVSDQTHELTKRRLTFSFSKLRIWGRRERSARRRRWAWSSSRARKLWTQGFQSESTHSRERN